MCVSALNKSLQKSLLVTA